MNMIQEYTLAEIFYKLHRYNEKNNQCSLNYAVEKEDKGIITRYMEKIAENNRITHTLFMCDDEILKVLDNQCRWEKDASFTSILKNSIIDISNNHKDLIDDTSANYSTHYPFDVLSYYAIELNFGLNKDIDSIANGSLIGFIISVILKELILNMLIFGDRGSPFSITSSIYIGIAENNLILSSMNNRLPSGQKRFSHGNGMKLNVLDKILRKFGGSVVANLEDTLWTTTAKIPTVISNPVKII